MAEGVDLNRGTVLGNGGPQTPGGAVPVMPVEMVLLNDEPTPILSSMFILLTDIRDTLHRIEAMSAEPVEVGADG